MKGVLRDFIDESIAMRNEIILYNINSFNQLNPFLLGLLSAITFLLFPSEIYITYASVVLIMIVLDIITKYYAIAEKNNGFWNALKYGHISSSAFWNGTRRKVTSYLIIMIVVGLAYNFEMLSSVVEFIATFVYLMMFLRESQSIAENLIESGYDVSWLLFFLRRKEKELVDKTVNREDEDINLNIKIDRETYELNDREEIVREVIETIEKKDKEENNV